MMEQPEALRLADALENDLRSFDGSSLGWFGQEIADDSAAELRRQHAEIERLRAVARHAELLCSWISETPHVRGSINGSAAQLRYEASEALKEKQ